MYPHQIFIGKVVDVNKDSGSSFSLLPPENASGNWVKVTQRFPVNANRAILFVWAPVARLP